MAFIHFGCWNKSTCVVKDFTDLTDSDTNITRVMSKLRQVIEDENPRIEFVAVAGDNYYPEKTTGDGNSGAQKIVRPSDLKSGFECLPKNVDVHIILGNHDLETNVGDTPEKPIVIETVDQTGLNTRVIEPSGACEILNIQMETVGEMTDAQPINLSMNVVKLFGNNLVIMIDSSMYEDDADVDDFLPCYARFLDNQHLTIESLREQQLNYITDACSEYAGRFKNIIFIGHHPITGIREKKGKIIPISPFESFVNMWIGVYSALHGDTKSQFDGELYYLCADLHLYQRGDVDMTSVGDGSTPFIIHQYIVGTGGTTLDPNPNFTTSLPFNVSTYNDGIVYTVIESEKKHGFLKCTHIQDQLPQFEFIGISDAGTQTAAGHSRVRSLTHSRRRTTRRKTAKRGKRTSKRRRRTINGGRRTSKRRQQTLKRRRRTSKYK